MCSGMPTAYIVEAVRSPVGKRGGGLSKVHPADLAAQVLAALVERSGVDPAEVDDVIFGCVDQAGAQGGDIARTAWLSAGLPESVPGVTIDRQCGSSQQATHFAAQAVMAGVQDLVIAGGVESMSVVPLGGSVRAGEAAGYGGMYGAGWRQRYGEREISQFTGAELIAEKWSISRLEMEEFALLSHQRAVRAIEHDRFSREIVALEGITTDEGPRRDTSLERMAVLPPIQEGGRLTAAVSSQISDGSAALLIASENAVRRYGLKPRARFHSFAVVGSDPILMLTGPIPATAKVLHRAGMSIGEIDLFEVNEAFASVVLAWERETGASIDKTNVNGGAIALGHPLGATGARLLTSLLHELERSDGRYGLQAMCEGGGQANATIIERLN
jgi:acetyl-CoA C-acetyltransferase